MFLGFLERIWQRSHFLLRTLQKCARVLYKQFACSFQRRSSSGASVGSGGGTGSSSAPDGEISQMKKMHTRCHRVITKIYHLSFIHFYSQDVLQTVDSSVSAVVTTHHLQKNISALFCNTPPLPKF